MKLKVISEYRNREIYYPVGAVINVDQKDASFLLADAPGCFEEMKEKPVAAAKDIEAPPANKAQKREYTKRK